MHERTPKAVVESSLAGAGCADNVGVEFAIAWKRKGKGPQVRSFVNYGETTLAGTHVQGLLGAVRASAPSEGAAEAALRGLVGVVHVTLLHPRFGGPTRAMLNSEAARAAVREVVAQRLAASPWWWDRLLENMQPHLPRKRPPRHR